MRSWKEALKEHKQVLEQAGYKEENILGVFCYGSQNYGISTEHSDWDTKAIIIPSYSDLIFKPATSKELHLPNGEHCEVKDIREIVKMFKKQNINFIEILYTEYKWINPIFKFLWDKYFINNRENIAFYDKKIAIKSIGHQAKHTISQNPFDGKKLANGYRLLRFLEKYINDDNYINCLILPKEEREMIIDVKNGNIHQLSADEMISKLDILLNKDDIVVDNEKQKSIEDIMECGVLHLILTKIPHTF